MRLTTVGKNRYEKKGIKGSFMSSVDCYQKVLRVPYGAYDTACCYCECKRKEHHLRRKVVSFASASMTGVPMIASVSFIRKARCKACAEEDIEDKGINAPNPSESLIRQMGEIT